MYRIDEICDHNGQMEDVYSEFNKWSFESEWKKGIIWKEFCLSVVHLLLKGFAVKMWSGMSVVADYSQTLSSNIMERELQHSQGKIQQHK